MVKITKIEIKNFKAFRGPDVIDLSEKGGQSLLLYGENGSGKTSLYEALKLFLESSENGSTSGNDPIRFIDHQNIFATDDGYVRLHFTSNPNLQKVDYEWSENALNDTKVQPISEASKAKAFLDYKELLKTNYLHHGQDSVNLFDLLVNALLANVTNDLTDPQRSFVENWRDTLDVLDAVQTQGTAVLETVLEEQREVFNRGLTVKLAELCPWTAEILSKFGYKVALDLDFQGVTYNRDEKTLDNQEILLKVKFFEEHIPMHHRFLNEAKLSAIALSIFLAGFQLQPSSDLKILALDDALIGLDMSNRLPLIDILDEYFSDYQIFLTTYDKAWYEIAKQRTAQKDWKYAEFYFGETDEYEVPIYVENKAYLEKAREYLDANDYKACAIYVRTAFEEIIKRFCNKRDLKVRYCENPKELTTKDFWEVITVQEKRSPIYPEQNILLLDQKLVDEIESAQKFILNPLSHANIVEIYKPELKEAIDAVERLKAALA